MGSAGIRDAYVTGRGSIRMRAVAEIEEDNGRERIVVTELPYQVNKANLAIKIAELVQRQAASSASATCATSPTARASASSSSSSATPTARSCSTSSTR